jgi:outer membrane lipoprotein-sorting protein
MITTLITLAVMQKTSSAQAMLDDWAGKLKTAKSIEVESQMSFNGEQKKSTFQWRSDGCFRFATDDIYLVTNSKGSWYYMGANKQYMKMPDPPAISQFVPGFAAPKAGFKAIGDIVSGTEFGKIVNTVTFKPEDEFLESVSLFFDPKTSLPIGSTMKVKGAPSAEMTKTQYTQVKFNQTLSDSVFAWNPPKDAKEYVQPDFAADLLKVGTQAPNFKAKLSTGKETSLKDLLKGKKGMILNFWFYG